MYDGLFKIIPALAGGAPRPDAFAAAGALQQPSRTPRAVGSRPPSRTRLGPGSDPARTRLGRSAVGTLRSEAFNVRMEERRLLALSLPPMPVSA